MESPKSTHPAIDPNEILKNSLPQQQNRQKSRPQTKKKAAPKAHVSELRNPGRFEDLNKEARNILEPKDNFDGLRVDWSRNVSQQFQIVHLLGFGSVMEDPNYGFAVTYARRKGHMLSGRWHPGKGAVQGRIHWPLVSSPNWGRVLVKATAMASGKPGMSQLSLETEYRGKDCTAQVKWHTGNIWELGYTQRIAPSLSVAVLGVYDHLPGRTELSGGLRYERKHKNFDSVWACSVPVPTKLQLNPFAGEGNGYLVGSCTIVGAGRRKIWTAEMQFAKPEGHDRWETAFAAGYEYRFISSIVKAKIDSNWRCSCILQETLNPIMSLQFCSDMDYAQDKYRIGLGFSLHA